MVPRMVSHIKVRQFYLACFLYDEIYQLLNTEVNEILNKVAQPGKDTAKREKSVNITSYKELGREQLTRLSGSGLCFARDDLFNTLIICLKYEIVTTW